MSGSGLHFAPVFDLKELPDHQLQPLLVTAQLGEVTAQDAAAGTTTVKCNKYGQVTLPDKLVAVVLDADLPAQGPQAAAERAGLATLRLLGDEVYDGITNGEKVKASTGLLDTMRYWRDVIHHDEQHSRSPAKPPSCAIHKRPRQPSSPGAVTPFLGGAPNSAAQASGSARHTESWEQTAAGDDRPESKDPTRVRTYALLKFSSAPAERARCSTDGTACCTVRSARNAHLVTFKGYNFVYWSSP